MEVVPLTNYTPEQKFSIALFIIGMTILAIAIAVITYQAMLKLFSYS